MTRFALLGLAALAAAPATAQTVVVAPTIVAGAADTDSYRELNMIKNAVPGQKVRIWYALSIERDCSTAGAMVTQILEVPEHGLAVVENGKEFPNFPAGNPRSACNTRRVPASEVYYTAKADFTGRDSFVMRNSTPDGHIRKITVYIDVR